MSDIIRLLPDAVANQIAAGEVIQRPASVIKELVENSIDAGATTVQVLVQDAGRTSIQVIDDGKGMSETDARLAFERHATSKIREAADLFALHTMGFRGEALASIAAVAEVELKTRLANEELGTHIVLSGSKLVSQELTSCPVGSNFLVRNLFFNVPARRKFLKSNATELSNILSEFERIALVNPKVSFQLYSNGTELFNLPVSTARQRIAAVFGKKLNDQLIPIAVETSLISIHGFIGKPETARKKGAHQYFFVNGRYMRHPYFHKAVMEAYEQLIPAGEQVSYFIYFEVEPSNIDVNIHPTKTEIKFENEASIWQILSTAVKEGLGKFVAVPTIDFDTEGKPDDLPVFNASNGHLTPPKVHYKENYNPFGASKEGGYQREYQRPKPVDWEQLYAGLQKDPLPEDAPAVVVETATLLEQATEAHQTELLQFKGRFILTSVKSGLMLIDQHRAHVRVLYDQYMELIARHASTSQGVLFPEVVQFSPSEATILEAILEDMAAVGFELTSLGGGSYAVNGVASGIEGLNIVELVHSMVHTAMEKGSDVKEEVQGMLALTLAKAAAIVYGQVLSSEEMSSLVDRLFTCSTPNYTPDGQLVLHIIPESEIEHLFSK